MGIADLWKIINSSERQYTLEQLANDQEEKGKGKSLRVAIDVALWIFQVRSSIVGEQSELRAMFFRFCKLYELGIRPVFVFDGPNRPEYKRDKFINTVPIETEFRRNLIALIKLFNFSMWDSYGEAEAECAMLQRLGFVDLVFTGDGDILLFGANRIVRQWPAKRHDLIPCYDIQWITETTGLDRSDLILIALLRGSDYDTKGTKGIGIHLAAQLAKCRFHRELMDDIQLAGREEPLDDERVQHLYDSLMYELEHNSTKNLTRKYNGVVLDPKFPDFSIVTDFIHPLTNIQQKSDPVALQKAKELSDNLNYHHEPDWFNLAPFAQISFHWSAKYLLKRFTYLLFPGYMSNKLRRQQPNYRSYSKTVRRNASLQRQSSSQTLLSDFFVSTPRHHITKDNKNSDLIQITSSKELPSKLKLYRVEWNRTCWEEFLDKLKPRLDFELINTTSSQIIEEEITSSQMKSTDNDGWQQVRRQWVNAIHIHNAYPRIVVDFKDIQSKKRSNHGQIKLDAFLIIPPKRRAI